MRWFDIADELLPPVYRAIKDMYAYAKSLDSECQSWVSFMERILNNFFIQRCDTQTIVYWERLLGITVHGDETLEQRRQTILAYLNNTTPITEPYVRSLLEQMFPNTNYQLWFDVGNNKPYDLYIDVFTTDDTSLREFRDWFTKMCPAHLCQSVAKAIETSFERNAIVNHAHICALSSSLPTLSHTYAPTPTPVPPGPVGTIYIGVSTACEAGTTTLNSPYFWMYNFNNSSSSNWYNPQSFQNATPPIQDGSEYPVGGERYKEVVLSNGDGGTWSPATFRLAQYNNAPEFYMDTSYQSIDHTKAGTIIRFGTEVSAVEMSFNLPYDMYSISGTTITWNMSHPLMVLLEGKACN